MAKKTVKKAVKKGSSASAMMAKGKMMMKEGQMMMKKAEMMMK